MLDPQLIEPQALDAPTPPASSSRPPSLSHFDERLSPHEVMIANLHVIRNALESEGIEYLLVRGADANRGTGDPTIAVNERDRAEVFDALARATRNDPRYLVPVGEPATGTLDDAGTAGRNVRRVGRGSGIRLEFWLYDAADIHLPNSNAVTRETLPRDEARSATVDVYGARWPTLDGMWDRLADDTDFPIDIVFSWVDGSDPDWQKARAATMQSYVVGEGDDHEARFRQINELKYALRSVHLFAPWIRNIVIVTDSPRPEWLSDHPKVRVVRSIEFFSDTRVLPTHNSHAVESQLHRIPGLSEHFIYSNDDMFFGREVGPEGFFTSGGISRFIESNTRIGLGGATPVRSGFENAARVNRALLLERFGRTISRNLEHSPAPLRRTILTKLEGEFPHEFERTAAARFRSVTDVSVTNSLYHYYALMTGYAVPQETLSVKYVDTTSREGIAALGPLLRDRDHDFFCLNDGSFPEISAKERRRAVTAFLEEYFPIPAPWEKECC